MAYWLNHIAFSFTESDGIDIIKTCRASIAPYTDSVAWLRPHNLHVTLGLKTWASESEYTRASEIIRPFTFTDFQVELTGKCFSSFSPTFNCTFLMLEVEPGEMLVRFRDTIISALHAQNIRINPVHQFHITICNTSLGDEYAEADRQKDCEELLRKLSSMVIMRKTFSMHGPYNFYCDRLCQVQAITPV